MTEFLTPLDRPALAAEGIPAPWAYGLRDRVRFYELDALGHVNNVSYLKWFETLRIPYARDYGLSRFRWGQDPTLVVISNAARYLAPMFLGDDYLVTGRTASFRTTSFRMEYGVFRAGSLCAAGEAVMVMMSPDGRQKRPLPAAVTALFETRDGARRER